jgi:hypothetical protein
MMGLLLQDSGRKPLGCVADDLTLGNAMLFIFKRVPFGLNIGNCAYSLLVTSCTFTRKIQSCMIFCKLMSLCVTNLFDFVRRLRSFY